MQDLHNRIHAAVAIIPQTQTNSDTAITGEIVDTAGFDAVEFVIATGTLTDADATFAVTLEHGDDPALGDTAQVTNSDLIGTLAGAGFTFASDKATRKLGYAPRTQARKRYLRLTVTPTGNNSGAAPIAAVCIMSSARTQPTT
jgi:predicted membrane GTPase involved in stress response